LIEVDVTVPLPEPVFVIDSVYVEGEEAEVVNVLLTEVVKLPEASRDLTL
jgi:hypothetical protein